MCIWQGTSVWPGAALPAPAPTPSVPACAAEAAAARLAWGPDSDGWAEAPSPCPRGLRREFRAASGQVASLLKLASPRLFLRVTPRFRPPLGHCPSAFPGLSPGDGPGAQGMGLAGLLWCLPILQRKLKRPKETRAPLPLGTCDRAQGSPASPTGPPGRCGFLPQSPGPCAKTLPF